MGIPLSAQVLSFQSIILENDNTMIHYGITNESELVLIEDAFQNHLVNKDVELVELSTWIDMLNNDYEETQKFIREADYIISKIHDLEGKSYGLDVIDDALTYVKQCHDRCSRFQEVILSYEQKFSFLSDEFNRFYDVVAQSKVDQLRVKQRIIFHYFSFLLEYEDLNLHSEDENETNSSSNHSEPRKSSISYQPIEQKEVNPFDDYITFIEEDIASGDGTVIIHSAVSPESDTPSSLLESQASFVRVNDDGMIIKQRGEIEEYSDMDDEDDRIQRDEIKKSMNPQLKLSPSICIGEENEDINRVECIL